MLAKHFSSKGKKPNGPAVDRGMVHQQAALLLHLFEMAVVQGICRLPTDANQNDVEWQTHPFGRQPRISSLFSQSTQHRPVSGLTANATQPIADASCQGETSADARTSCLTSVNTGRQGAAGLLGPCCGLISEVSGTEHTDPWAPHPVGRKLVQAHPLARGI